MPQRPPRARPPACRPSAGSPALIVSANDQAEAESACPRAGALRRGARRRYACSGPAEAPLAVLRGRHRVRLIVKTGARDQPAGLSARLAEAGRQAQGLGRGSRSMSTRRVSLAERVALQRRLQERPMASGLRAPNRHASAPRAFRAACCAPPRSGREATAGSRGYIAAPGHALRPCQEGRRSGPLKRET